MLNVSVFTKRYTVQNDLIKSARSPAIQLLLQYHVARRWCWLNVWNRIVLTLDEQKVRWHWCKFEFECLTIYLLVRRTVNYLIAIYCTLAYFLTAIWRWHTYGSAVMLISIEYMERYGVGFGRIESKLLLVHVWIWMYHDIITIAHAPTTQIHYNANGLLWLCVDVDWIYGTISCRFWPHSKYVVIGACPYLNASLHDIRCTLAPSRLHTHLLIKYTTMAMEYGSALIFLEYMKRCRVDVERTDSTLVLVHVLIGMCHCLVYARCTTTPSHICTLPIEIQRQCHTALRWRSWWWNIYMTRYCAGFERTGGALVLMHVWIR